MIFINCYIFFFDKKWNVTRKVLEVTFERKKIQFFRRCQNDGCEVSQLYYSVSKQPPTFLYEIINSKREKKPTKIYENHKIAKLFLLCSLEGYGQHFMSRLLSTKTTVSPAWSFWYNIVLDGQFLKLISHWKLNLVIWNFRQLAHWFFLC